MGANFSVNVSSAQ